MSEFLVFVGVDWGSESHQTCAIDDDRGVLLEKGFPHSGKGLSELVEALVALADGRAGRIAVAIEKPHGAVVETLLERGISVFAINPKQLDRFRDRHSVAGAKDDRRDALVLADSLRTDRQAFRQVQLGDPKLVLLREMSRMQDSLFTSFSSLGGWALIEMRARYIPGRSMSQLAPSGRECAAGCF